MRLRYVLRNGRKVLQELVTVRSMSILHNVIREQKWIDVPFVSEDSKSIHDNLDKAL